MGMLKTVSQAWKVPEIRKKMIFTLLMLLVYRIGSNIPVPNINRDALQAIMDPTGGGTGLLEMMNVFSGGALGNFTIFALSITPYITASIVIQLLTMAFPYFERMAKEGMEGRKKMAQITRYLTVVLGLLQAIGMTVGLFRQALVTKTAFDIIVVVLVLTAGTAFLMWLGEQINDKGIGNGISLLIFAGIVARIPDMIQQVGNAKLSPVAIAIILVVAVLIIAGVVFIQEGQRKIPVQYAKRVVGRKMYGGQSTHIPIKVNQSGVIPIIFASSLLMFPQTIFAFFGRDSAAAALYTKYFSTNGIVGVWVYSAVNIILIIAFTFFYTTVSFNPVDVADNMKSNGGFIPGIRPGRATQEYLKKVMLRITIVGAIFLAIIATMPIVLGIVVPSLKGLQFGGTSLLIAVGVALETVRQLENQMLMRNYQGFLK